MADIKRGARAYYADTDYRRDGMIEAYGKIDDLIIVANPDVETTAVLNKLTIGANTYLVNESVAPTNLKVLRTVIKSIHGQDANVVLNGLRLRNSITSDFYQFTGGDSIVCSTGADVSGLINNQIGESYVPASNIPFSLDITFGNPVSIKEFNEFGLICGYYENASPLAVDIYGSVNGEDFILLGSNNSVSYSRNAFESFLVFGEAEVTIPEPTAANAGKLLGVANSGGWELDNVPSELPAVTSADAGKVLAVNNQGAWGAEKMASNTHAMLLSMNNVTFNSDTNRYSGVLDFKVDNTPINYTITAGEIPIKYGELFAIFINTANVIALRGVGFNFNGDTTTRTCIERILKNCAFFNDIDHKMYKITNITGSSTSRNFEFELIELSA